MSVYVYIHMYLYHYVKLALYVLVREVLFCFYLGMGEYDGYNVEWAHVVFTILLQKVAI